ncbi:MAG: T9SS type A sorting domain-containing protein, partial [Melioribacteraceae bacterium]|nr:T9SS type A sorting domain-containing protein [Melioribacteraceae bacterium]
LVNSNFTLIVKLTDETGLNTTGTGVGHKLEAILNDNEDNAIDLSNYFVGDLDAGGKSGSVNYRFTNLDPGEYKIKIKAWDVFNNNAEEEKFFSVVSGDDLVVRNVVNYPNPFNSETTFTMQHNSNNPIDVRILIYTIAGRKIKEISKQSILERFVKIPWDGRDADGNLIANGTYLYKVIVESQTGEFKENILGKLAVIR